MAQLKNINLLTDHGFIKEHIGYIAYHENAIIFSFIEFDGPVNINDNNLNISGNQIIYFERKNNNETSFFTHENLNTLNYEFNDCIFHGNIDYNPQKERTLTIEDCTFRKPFYINISDNERIEINAVTIKNSIFEKDFGVYKASINSIEIKNVDFEALSEFNEVTFQEKFDLREITYKGLTLFDKCVFNTKAELEYVIFEKFTSFRSSIFNKGLNLDYTSGDKEINFFGINGLESNESKKNTTRETYRIIKNSFENIGNKIEANEYLTLELERHRKDTWSLFFQEDVFNHPGLTLKLLLDGVVSFFHWISSNHSSNWLLALFWIFILSVCTNKFLGHELSVNYIFQYINILSSVKDFNYFYPAMVLNKVILGYLYYQFLTAVRKDTRK